MVDDAQKRGLSWTAWDFHLKAGLTLIKDWAYGPTVPGQIVKDKLAAAAVAHGSNN
jgi:hypothetical protein